MPGLEDVDSPPLRPLYTELSRMRKSNLNAAIDDVDSLIDMLTRAREQVASGAETHRVPMTMLNLQKAAKVSFESINNDLKEVTKAQKGFGKALDKAIPEVDLPTETDAMAAHPTLINRAIAMHLLREGRFSVASTFLQESQNNRLSSRSETSTQPTSRIDADGDDDMTGVESDLLSAHIHSEDLQNKFSEMYRILSELKARNLLPAISWARDNWSRLDARGSNLEFELSKLQFVFLFKGHEANGLPDDENNGPTGAMRYARSDFARFQSRHLKEIQELCCAMVYSSNIEQSPYRRIFEIDHAFEDVSLSFTREFCSLLGLSAESPLHMAITAGAIALPRLIKYTTHAKTQKTEWTTKDELAFETPLPESMVYHPIFVCPVSKEQVTDSNPAMMLPCSHVICHDSLKNMARGQRYKCPYCPTEGHLKDAIRVTL